MTLVKGVQTGELERIWPRVAGLVAAGMGHCKGRFSLSEIKASIGERKRQLWVTWPDCATAGITQMDAYPDLKVLTIFAFAGAMPADWRDILGKIERWAADQGCSMVRLEGRRGWLRKLPAGYKPGLIEFTKVIP